MCRGWTEVKIFIEHSHLLKWDLSLTPEINRLVQLGSLLHGFSVPATQMLGLEVGHHNHSAFM